MKIQFACAQMEIIAGRPDVNTQKILQLIAEAKRQNIDVILFPEMAIPGYLIGDLWDQQEFVDDCLYYGGQVIQAAKGIVVIFGNVAVDPARINEDGRIRKYNAAYIAQDQKLIPLGSGENYVIKTSLPNYREFDDKRYFTGAAQLSWERGMALEKMIQPLQLTIHGSPYRLGVMLCEDGWNENYDWNVPKMLVQNGAQILLNLSASPFSLQKNAKRHRLFGAQAQSLNVPLLYCNAVGVQNNGKNIFTFDGCSTFYTHAGEIESSAPMYEETLMTAEFTPVNSQISSTFPIAGEPADESAAIYKAIIYGTEHFLLQTGIRKMVVGVSGGIDSSVTAAVYVKVLGGENVLLVNMPSRYNSETTRDAARELSYALEANYCVIPIQESVDWTEKQLTETPIVYTPDEREWKLDLSPLCMENIQARDRGARILAGIAAAFGGANSCNSNKSETTVGYATFYGDLSGAMAMIGDLWKHQVYALGRYLNETVYGREVIPETIFAIKPSAELNASQTVGVGGDPLEYSYHDYLFKAFEEWWHKASPADVLSWYRDGVLEEKIGCQPGVIHRIFPNDQAFIIDLERWWKLFAGFAVAKRIQAPPILSISRRAYGYDQREAQLSPYFSTRFFQLKESILKNED